VIGPPAFRSPEPPGFWRVCCWRHLESLAEADHHDKRRGLAVSDNATLQGAAGCQLPTALGRSRRMRSSTGVREMRWSNPAVYSTLTEDQEGSLSLSHFPDDLT